MITVLLAMSLVDPPNPYGFVNPVPEVEYAKIYDRVKNGEIVSQVKVPNYAGTYTCFLLNGVPSMRLETSAQYSPVYRAETACVNGTCYRSIR